MVDSAQRSAGGGSGSLADQSYGSEPFLSPLGACPGSVAQSATVADCVAQSPMPSWANAPAASVASLACRNSWSVNNSLNIPSNASISQFLARSSSVDDTVMTDTLPIKPGAASGDSSLLRLATVASSCESVEGGRRGSVKGADSGAPRCHAFSNAFRQSGSIHSGMSGSVEGFLEKVQAEELPHNPRSYQVGCEPGVKVAVAHTHYAALYDGETHGIRSHRGARGDGEIKQPLQPHALVQVNAAPAGKRGSGGFPVGGGGAARGGGPACRGQPVPPASAVLPVPEHANVEHRHRGALRLPPPPPPPPFPSTPPAHPESERPEKMLCQRAEGSGAHVRARPEMQLKARSGQAHWHDKAKDMREIWNKRRMQDPVFAGYSEFPEQMDMCAKLQIKSQHECLLRELHLSVADGLITPKAFSTSQNDSFLGWTGFQIESTRAHEFRQRIEALFPEPPQNNTLHTAFRRTGLVPAKWEPGWLGREPFNFDSNVRQSYTKYAHSK